MKKLIMIALFLNCVIVLNAQFVLTPLDGLKTPDNAYIIKRDGTASDNCKAIKNVIKTIIPDANLIEVEYEKVLSIEVNKDVATKQEKKESGYEPSSYKMKIELMNSNIYISFEELGSIVSGGFVFYPKCGDEKITLGRIMAYLPCIFKTNGKVRNKPAKEGVEKWANNLMSQIEKDLTLEK